MIPARSLSVLASISRDSDVYEMGLAGKTVVFWDGTPLFTARLMEGSYPNTARITEQFKPRYAIRVLAEELAAAVSSVSVLEDKSPKISLSFGEHEIKVCMESAYGSSAMPVKALVLSAPGQPFCYNAKALLNGLRTHDGTITVEFDAAGLLAIRTGKTQYYQSPMRPAQQARQAA